MLKNFLILAICALSLGACALCHGHDGSDGASMQSYWDHSNMRW